MNLNLINRELLLPYLSSIKDLKLAFDNLKEADLSSDNFSFYTSVASVFSTKIEGEEIDLDSYIKHKKFGISYLPDYTKKIDDLYAAYDFAKENALSKTNIEEAHKILSANFLPTDKRGKLRTSNMFVTTDEGKIEYVAISPYELEAEMQLWYQDLNILLNQELNTEEVFYYAAILHLTFVKIHPWNDGNGRCARLIEKWFIAQKLGENAWFLQSEKYYYLNHDLYYSNIRKLGLEYPDLDYAKALDFLLMLPKSLNL